MGAWLWRDGALWHLSGFAKQYARARKPSEKPWKPLESSSWTRGRLQPGRVLRFPSQGLRQGRSTARGRCILFGPEFNRPAPLRACLHRDCREQVAGDGKGGGRRERHSGNLCAAAPDVQHRARPNGYDVHRVPPASTFSVIADSRLGTGTICPSLPARAGFPPLVFRHLPSCEGQCLRDSVIICLDSNFKCNG
jgi:hypothetical protein